VLAVVVMTTWKTVGFPMLIFLTGLQAIPVELHEAAVVDGASSWQRLRYITLPLLKPVFALVLVLQVSAGFLVFDQFFLMTKGGPANSTVSAVHWIYSRAFINYDVGYGAALAVVVLVLLVGINLIQMRVLREGGTARATGRRAKGAVSVERSGT
jgi:multiple sugar transport system permease protein